MSNVTKLNSVVDEIFRILIDMRNPQSLMQGHRYRVSYWPKKQPTRQT
jgi:hypothetical protein